MTIRVAGQNAASLRATLGPEAAVRSGVVAPASPPPGVVSLIGGQPDETLTATGATLSADTTIKRMGVQSWKLTFAAGGTATARLGALTSGPIQEHCSAFGLLLYIPDPTRITTLTAQVYTDTGDANLYQFNFGALRGGLAGNLRAGWNLLRLPAAYRTTTGSPAPWGTIDHVRVVLVANAATAVNIQQVFVETRPKASLLFIHDGGYSAFDQSPGYHDLRDRNIPVTWSVDCGLIGDVSHVTDARLREIAAENGNSISFHGWDGTLSSGMTAAQAQAATVKCVKWLAARGYAGRIWRSAWLQNSAPQSPATDSLVLANAMFGADNVERIHAWPFHDRYNVVRHQFHGRTTSTVDGWFTELEANRGLMVGYTHVVDDAGGSDITTAEWAYLLSKMDAAMSEGWLECVTLETLLARSGVRFQQGLGGGWTAEWPQPDGTTTTQQLL